MTKRPPGCDSSLANLQATGFDKATIGPAKAQASKPRHRLWRGLYVYLCMNRVLHYLFKMYHSMFGRPISFRSVSHMNDIQVYMFWWHSVVGWVMPKPRHQLHP